jgi:iron complex transport system permease protein
VAYLIARSLGNGSLVVLILAGVVISAFFQALIAITQYLADPLTTLPAITFWLMGGLHKVARGDLLALVPIAIGLLVLLALRWRINVLALGDEEASALGIDLARTRLAVVLSATLMTAAAVSLSGIIGWVGLVVPHLARSIVGPNLPVLLPASFLLGGSFLLVVDTIARSATSVEIPLGILTALIGAPFFIALLARARQGWV